MKFLSASIVSIALLLSPYAFAQDCSNVETRAIIEAANAEECQLKLESVESAAASRIKTLFNKLEYDENGRVTAFESQGQRVELGYRNGRLEGLTISGRRLLLQVAEDSVLSGKKQ